MNILLVEDDEAIASVVRRGLELNLYKVSVARDGERGMRMATTSPFALIILDWMLPQKDGLQICAELRAQKIRTPILMLTAKSGLVDKVQGFETGADDYLTKPFEFPELLARVKALMRRERIHKGRLIKVADLEIDTRSRKVTRAGDEIALTKREYLLLEALAGREGQVLSREVIQRRVWMDEDAYSNVVDVYIRSLRKKLDTGHEHKLIRTVHGHGYRIEGPET